MLAKPKPSELRSRRATRFQLVAGLTVVGLFISFASGCSICPNPYDCDYPTFGSRTPRTDMRNGRVGSIFSDPALIGSQSPAHSSQRVEYVEDEGVVDEYGNEMIEYEDSGDISGVEIGDPR